MSWFSRRESESEERIRRLSQTTRTLLSDLRRARRQLKAERTEHLKTREAKERLSSELTVYQKQVLELLLVEKNGNALNPSIQWTPVPAPQPPQQATPEAKERDQMKDALWLAAGGDIKLRRFLQTFVDQSKAKGMEDKDILHQLSHWPEDDGASKS